MDNKENDELLGGPNFCLKRKDVDATFSQCPSPSTAPEQSGINREKTKFHERVPPPTHTLNHKWLEVLFLFFFQQPRLTGIKIYTRYYKSSGGGGGLYISVRAHANIYINQILFFLFLGSGRVLLHDTIAIDRPSFVSAVTTQI